MADWTDFLEGLSGGVSGFVKGIDTGMAPLKTWEGIRTSDLANDATEIKNRDLDLTQQMRENPDFNYYGNLVGAADVGNRQKIASGEYDIFGNQQKLDIARMMSDPDSAFQIAVQEAGLTPGSPEYRALAAQFLGQRDPLAAIAAYDKMNIPGLEQRNLNEQAILAGIEEHARQLDPGAFAVRNNDGTVSVIGSNGEETRISGDDLMKIASKFAAKTPEDAYNAGIKQQIDIAKANAQIIKDIQDNNLKTPNALVSFYKDQGVRLNQALTSVRTQLRDAEKVDTKLMSDEEKAAQAARIADLRQQVDGYQKQMDQNQAITNQIVQRVIIPQLTGMGQRRLGVGGASTSGLPNSMVNPITGTPMFVRDDRRAPASGGSSVTTQRPSVQGLLAQAGGVPRNIQPQAGADVYGAEPSGVWTGPPNMRDPQNNSFYQILRMLDALGQTRGAGYDALTSGDVSGMTYGDLYGGGF